MKEVHHGYGDAPRCTVRPFTPGSPHMTAPGAIGRPNLTPVKQDGLRPGVYCVSGSALIYNKR
jgi:hypothetical protein